MAIKCLSLTVMTYSWDVAMERRRFSRHWQQPSPRSGAIYPCNGGGGGARWPDCMAYVIQSLCSLGVGGDNYQEIEARRRFVLWDSAVTGHKESGVLPTSLLCWLKRSCCLSLVLIFWASNPLLMTMDLYSTCVLGSKKSAWAVSCVLMSSTKRIIVLYGFSFHWNAHRIIVPWSGHVFTYSCPVHLELFTWSQHWSTLQVLAAEGGQLAS